jgi:outer membrane protein assembly factor BamB
MVEFPTEDELTVVDEYYVAHTAEKDKRRESWNLDTHDVLLCMDRKTGRTLWKTQFKHMGMTLNSERHGPWQFPVVANGRVYMQGTGGYVYCVDAISGEQLWVADTGPATWALRTWLEYQRPAPALRKRMMIFEFCSSPAWAEGVVAVNDLGDMPQFAGTGRKGAPGSPPPSWTGNDLVGLDGETGKIVWRVKDCTAVVSSPVRWRSGGEDYFIAGGPRSVVCVEAKTGAERWRVEGAFRVMVDPVVAGDLLVTVGDPRDKKTAGKSERLALAAYRITPEKAEKLWEDKPWTGHAHGCSPIVQAGRVYFIGKMYDAETGAVTGSKVRHIGMGTSLIGGDLFFHYGSAQKIGADGKATAGSSLPELKPNSKTRLWGGESFISPTYADGRLYIRGTIPGSHGSTWAQRIKEGLPPEHGCVYCFDLRMNPPAAAALTNKPTRTEPLTLLQSPHLAERTRGVEALSKLDADAFKPLLPKLLELLEADDWQAVSSALQVLQRAGSAAGAAAPILRKHLLSAMRAGRDERMSAMTAALTAVDAKAGKGLSSEITASLGEADVAQVLAACGLIQRLGPAAAATAPALTKALQRDEPRVRIEAARALRKAEIATETVCAALSERLQDANWMVTAEALKALAAMGSAAEGAVPDVLAILNAKKQDRERKPQDWALARLAILVLGQVEELPAEAGPAVFSWMARPGLAYGHQGRLAHALYREGRQVLVGMGAHALPTLLDPVKRTDRFWAPAAIKTLHAMGEDAVSAVPLLKSHALSSPNPRNYMLIGPATAALLTIDPSQTGAIVEQRLVRMKQGEPGDKKAVGKWLASIGRSTTDEAIRKSVIGGLSALVTSEDLETAEAACIALGALGKAGSDAIPALKQAAEKEELAAAAGKAIEGIEGARKD